MMIKLMRDNSFGNYTNENNGSRVIRASNSCNNRKDYFKYLTMSSLIGANITIKFCKQISIFIQ